MSGRWSRRRTQDLATVRRHLGAQTAAGARADIEAEKRKSAKLRKKAQEKQ